LIKYVSIAIPEAGPLGETFFDVRPGLSQALLFVPAGGYVESVLTFDTQRFFLEFATRLPPGNLRSFEMQPIPGTALVKIVKHFLFRLTVDI
jgi:hypothetical protein